MRTKLIVGVLLALFALAVPATARAITFDKAVAKLVRQGYPKRIVKKLMGFKSNAMGFRWAGSKADTKAARFIAAEMRRIGMVDVRLEPVPVDSWTPKTAFVKVGKRRLRGSAYPGTAWTTAKGRSGEVVYVGTGTKAEYADRDVAGKIVLIDAAPEMWWYNFPAAEADYRGAAAIIMSYDPAYPGYQAQAGAFASEHPSFSKEYPPMMWLRRSDAQWLKAKVTTAPATRVRFVLRTKYKMATNGGRGYNAVGSIRGRVKNAGKIVIGSHHDAHFRGALDGATGCALGLTIMKAAKMSRYKPTRMLVLFSATGSEWGYSNCNYDWSVGATNAIRTTHADWAGKTAAFLNAELAGCRGGTLGFTVSDELAPWIRSVLASNPRLAASPSGEATYVLTPEDEEALAFSFNDQWPFTASGIPSVTSWGQSTAFEENKQHTQYDNYKAIDWRFFTRQTQLQWRLVRDLDKGVLPYDLKAQADALAAAVDPALLAEDGLNATVADSFSAAVAELSAAAGAFNDAKAMVTNRKQMTSLNRKMMSVAKDFNRTFIALNVWDYTCYPFEQSQQDLESLLEAVDALAPGHEDSAEALQWLDAVDLTWYGSQMSHSAYETILAMRSPNYYRLNLAVMAHMPEPLDLMHEYGLVQTGDYAGARAGLQNEADAIRDDMNESLFSLTDQVREITAKVVAMTPQ